MTLKRRHALAGALLFLVASGALAFLYREPLILTFLATRQEATSLDARKALIAPSMQYFPPANREPPYPAALLFHGCAGVRQPFMEQWARIANEAGYLAVVVDSNGPRGFDREESLDVVCGGKALIGQERAGDVLAAVDLVRARSDVDPEKIVLAGWSHGGWSVMDFIALTSTGRRIAGLERDETRLVDVAGVITVYPYCGLGTWTRLVGWARAPKTLALIAGEDTIVDPSECPPVFARLAARGADVETHVYDGVDHVFDDPYLDPEFQYFYDETAHRDAIRRYKEFLKNVAGGEPAGASPSAHGQ